MKKELITLVIDSFEARGCFVESPEIPDALIEYAHKVCEIMGRPDAQIMFGPNFNHIESSRFGKYGTYNIKIIGQPYNDTYIDCMGGFDSLLEPIRGTMIPVIYHK